MKPNNLITTWLASQTQCGEPLKNALEQLNLGLGTKYGHNHLSMWRRGVRRPSGEVIIYMLESCLFYALRQEGFGSDLPLEDEPYQRLARSLTPPDKS